MPSTTSSAVINKMKAIFARFGIPEKLVSDNGPQFAAEGFSRFSHEWGFRHVTTSPIYQQANGLGQKSVQTAKQLLKKAKVGSQDSFLSLLEYRNTQIDGLSSPAQLLMSRRLRASPGNQRPAKARSHQPQDGERETKPETSLPTILLQQRR